MRELIDKIQSVVALSELGIHTKGVPSLCLKVVKKGVSHSLSTPLGSLRSRR